MGRRFALTLTLIATLAVGTLAQAPGVHAAEACFTETGFCIQGRFLAYWQNNGGLARNGYPLSIERTEILEDGKTYRVQYFERVRMELHPENQAPYDVLLGQFGRRVFFTQPFYSAHGLEPTQPVAGLTYFPQTGHNVDARFLAYWQANGGLTQFGYPIAETSQEVYTTGQGMFYMDVQYFERARLEYHAEQAGTAYDIQLGQFGRQVLAEVDLLAGDPRFAAVYTANEQVREWLLAPEGPVLKVEGATQRFEHGRMFYLARNGGIRVLGQPNSEGWIYAMCGDGQTGAWWPFADTWQEGQEPGGGPAPTGGLYYPQRGFGKLWRERQEIRDCLGLAITPDEQALTATVQHFRQGVLLATPAEDVVYALHYGTFTNGSVVFGSTGYRRYPTPAR